MKGKTLFGKLNFLIALAILCTTFVLGSCGNLLSSDLANADSVQTKECYGTVSGVCLENANFNAARTAMPGNLDTTNIRYEVFAENGTERISATVNGNNFSIALPFGTWEVTVLGFPTIGGNQNKVCLRQTKRISLSAKEPNKTLNFELIYSTNPEDGAGTTELVVEFPDVVKSVDYVLQKGTTRIAVKLGANEVAAKTFKILQTLADLGAYDLTIYFYDESSMLVYRIDQVVNVYANLTTNIFDGNAPYISDGKIVLTKPLLDDFKNSTIYVNAQTGSDTNTGTQFDPVSTLSRAMDLVEKNSSTTEFRIFLQSDVGDAGYNGNGFIWDGTGKKLTIAGADGTTRTVESLNCTFTVAASSELVTQSVNFQKLRFDVSGDFVMNGGKIRGNKATVNGGAVYIANAGTFTMNGGEISGNEVAGNNNKGVGVYVADGGTFKMSGSAKITEDNDVYISSGVVNITDELSEDFVAKITIPQDQYTNGTQIIYKNGAGAITKEICDKFTVTPDSNGIEWKIVPDATLEYGVLKSEADLIYVRGTGAGWYEDNGKGDIIGDDNNSGSREHPFATIQKAIDTVLIRNDGSKDYTIYVDGEVTLESGDKAGREGMASFNSSGSDTPQRPQLSKNLTLKIAALSEKTKATLNANRISRVINGAPDKNVVPAPILNLTLENLVITGGEHTNGGGGGIYLRLGGGTCKAINCDIIDNGAKQGGGVYVNCKDSDSTFEMDGGKISNNKAVDGDGGGVYINIDNDSSNGVSKFEPKNNVEISGNMASGRGGGIYVGDGIDFEMTDGTTISKNKAASGGGIYVANTAAFTLTGGTISENTATTNGGGICFGIGAGVTGKVAVRGGTISGNSSSSGGGIFSAGTLEMVGAATIEKNKATNGAGVYVNGGGIFTMTDGTIEGNGADEANIASKNGGGVYIQSGGKMTIGGGKVSNNKAEYGAGIYAYRSMPSTSDITLTMSGGEISDNISDSYGGGIYVLTGTFAMNGGVIKGNTTSGDGGGICIYNGTVTMSGSAAIGKQGMPNRAKNGGGVYLYRTTSSTDGGRFEMRDNSAISGNSAESGGGIWASNFSEFKMFAGSFSGNKATAQGKGAYINPSCTLSMIGIGAAKFAEDDDIYLYTNTGLPIPTIQIAGALTESKVATITPSDYVDGREVLSAASGSGVTIDQTICDKFAVTPEGSTKWQIVENTADNTGILKKGDSSGGIQVVIPGVGTYNFDAINASGGVETPLTDGMTLVAGSTITLKVVKDENGHAVNCECVLEIRESGTPLATATGTPTISISVPTNLPPSTQAQVYMKVTLDGGTSADKTIDITI